MHWEEHLVDAGAVRLHVLAAGPAGAEALLFLHGGCAHARWWDCVAPLFAARYRVFALDLRGHGDSGHLEPPAYRLADYAADVGAVMDRLELPAVHLVGHSLGGMVAGAFAARESARLRSLSLVDTQLHFTETAVRYLRRLASFPQMTYADEATARDRFRLLPTDTNASRELIDQVAAFAFRRRDDGRWVLKFDRNALMQIEPVDLLPGLAATKTPLLLVRGGQSAVLGHARLQVLRNELPRAEVAEVADAHHHVMLDNQPAFAAALAGFLERC